MTRKVNGGFMKTRPTILMRKMIAYTKPIKEYDSPAKAICASEKANSRLRSVSDDQVRDRTILRILWDDTTLTLELEGGKYLNIVAQSGGVGYSLDDTPAVTNPALEDDVILELNGKDFEWHKGKLAQEFVGKPLTRLFFGEDTVFIYVPCTILACNLIMAREDGRPWLFWDET